MPGRFTLRLLTLLLIVFPSIATAQTLSFVDADGEPAASYLEGTTAYLRLEDPAMQGYTSASVDVSSTLGADFEMLMLTETPIRSGVFIGSIELDMNGSAQPDGLLQTATDAGPPFSRDTLQADYNTGAATANAGLLGSKTRFLDMFGQETAVYADFTLMRLQIEDHKIDNPLIQDSFFADVYLSAFPGIVRTVQMTETGLSTGIFEGGNEPPFGDPAIETVHDDADGPTSSQASATYQPNVTQFIDEEGRTTSTFVEGSRAYIRVIDPAADQSYGPNFAYVEVGALLTGDTEYSVVLEETGESTGVFVGSVDLLVGYSPKQGIETSRDPGPPLTYDTLTVDYYGPYGDPSSATAMTAAPHSAFLDAADATVTVVAQGSRARVQVVDPKVDESPLRQNVSVQLDSDSGDVETLVLEETGLVSGVFEGSIDLGDPFSGYSGDGELGAYQGDDVRAMYTDSVGVTIPNAEAYVVPLTIAFLDEDGLPATEILESGTVRLRLDSPSENYFPDSIDYTGAAVLSLTTGDYEDMYLYETGPDTGIFEGSIPLGPAPSTSYDGVLQSSAPDRITADVASFGVVTVPTVGSRIVFTGAGGEEAEVFPADGDLGLRLYAYNRNDPAVQDVATVTLTAPTNRDLLTLQLTETGLDTGIFEGSQTTTSIGSLPYDSSFTAPAGERIEAVHVNLDGSTSSQARARMEEAILTFVDAAGAEAEYVLQGTQAFVRLHSPYNDFSSAPDIAYVNLATVVNADAESLELTETGNQTGIFEGSIDVRLGIPSYNGIMEVVEVAGPPPQGDVLEASYYALADSIYAYVGTIGSRTSFIDAGGQVKASYAVGETVYVRVEDHNVDVAGVVDTTSVSLIAPLDSEQLTLTETGPSTGIFEGSIPFGLDTAVQDDGFFYAQPGAQLTAVHADVGGNTQSEATALTVSSALYFVDAQGAPTSELAEAGVARLRAFSYEDNFNTVYEEFIAVELTTLYGGDYEYFGLIETGPDTGVFEGTIQLSGPSASGYDVLDTADSGPPDFLPEEVTGTMSGGIGTGTAVALVLPNAPPVVTITAPADGSVVNLGDSASFSGSASDPDDGDLTAGLTWTSDLDDVIGTGGSFSTSALTAGVHVITASVSDSGGTPGSASITLTINEPPTANISSPSDGSVYNEGFSVDFSGEAWDPEEGPLANSSWSSDLDGVLSTDAVFSTSTLTPGVHVITLSVTDSHGAPASASITVTINVPPVVTISAPSDGSVFNEGESVSFAGTSLDPEDGDLTTSLVWHSNVEGAIGTSGSFSTSNLSVGTHVVIATSEDSTFAFGSAAITITINAVPTVNITSPSDGSDFNEGDSVSFMASASDFEDGDLTGSLAWSSDLDGAIGSGGSFSTAALTVGAHVITASVTDSNGASGSAAITLTINAAPTVTITAPVDGSVYNDGASVSFAGSGSDSEDGDLTASLAWASDIDGAIGTGGSFSTSALTVGVHVITASLTDSAGAPGSASITVNVNGLPTASITAPADGSVFALGANVTFTGTASDPEDGSLTAALSWTSSLDGAIGTGGSFSTTGLSSGVHLITASVTDSNGVPASDAITLTVNASPAVTITAPADGTVVATGDSVTFTASAIDPEDGDLGPNLTWTSDLDGVIGSGGSFSTTALTAGTHLITASVTDSSGAPGADAFTVIVKVPVQVTFTSIGGEDGWVRESNESSNVGNRHNTNHIRAGDHKKDKQFKGFVSFDTSAIPDGAVLRSANLRLKRWKVSGTNPFSTHGALTADIQTGGFGGSTALANSDFQATATATGVATLSNAPSNGDWSEGLLDAAGLAALNVTGATQLRISFALDDNDDSGNDYMQYYTGADTNSTRHPQLVVEYLE